MFTASTGNVKITLIPVFKDHLGCSYLCTIYELITHTTPHLVFPKPFFHCPLPLCCAQYKSVAPNMFIFPPQHLPPCTCFLFTSRRVSCSCHIRMGCQHTCRLWLRRALCTQPFFCDPHAFSVLMIYMCVFFSLCTVSIGMPHMTMWVTISTHFFVPGQVLMVWLVIIGLGWGFLGQNCLVQVMACCWAGNKPLPKPMITKMPDTIWHYQATLR